MSIESSIPMNLAPACMPRRRERLRWGRQHHSVREQVARSVGNAFAGIYVRGLNLAPRGALRANGDSAPAEVSPVAIGLVALRVVVVIASGSKDDGKEEPACPAIFPPPPGCAAPQ